MQYLALWYGNANELIPLLTYEKVRLELLSPASFQGQNVKLG